jgi:N-acyl-D-amino-acid deacylase
MAHDLVIRNANIVDGTGAAPYAADLAVDDGTISALGKVDDSGKEEIDAKGNAVTPGFIDLHTHLDAQIGWDPDLTSITWHGVTTALLGNCGVTFAPCKPEDREFLAGMMETVEDIPKKAIMSGLPWDWESYGGYLDSIAKSGPMINVAGLVGHCATRFYVMGERSVEEAATPDEIAQIAEIAAQSVKEGALGFSTNRHLGHFLPDGRCIPGTHAEKDELRAVAKAIGPYGGIMQTVMNFTEIDQEMDLIGEEAALCRGSLFSAVAGHSTEQGRFLDKKVTEIRQHGHNVTGVTVPRAGGGVGGLSTNNFFRTAAWNELRKMDFEGRLNALKDESVRTKLVQELKDNPNADAIINQTRNWFPMGLGERPKYTGSPDESVYAIASAAGEHPAEVWIRMTLESEGKMLFHHRGFNTNLDSLAEMISTDWAMPGLGDAGAHVSQMIDSGWSTFVLSHWHRDAGLYSIEEAVRRIAGVPADVLGLSDRGTLAVGKRADINVIDIDRIEERQPYIANDFPHGAPRFIQRAVGYQATLCNGQVILRDDEHTGTRSGQVLKNQST